MPQLLLGGLGISVYSFEIMWLFYICARLCIGVDIAHLLLKKERRFIRTILFYGLGIWSAHSVGEGLLLGATFAAFFRSLLEVMWHNYQRISEAEYHRR